MTINPESSPPSAVPIRLFTWIAPFLYLAFALITPPFQTPDEHQHLFRAWQLASGHLFGRRQGRESGGDLPPALARAAEHEVGSAAPHVEGRPLTKTGFGERFSHGTMLIAGEMPRFTNFLGSALYSPAGYAPQVIAIEVGRGLDLTIESIVRLGRILNALLTFVLLWAAFRMLPFGRLVLLVIALLPMTASCAGSLGQDGLIIGGTAWLVALGLRAMSEGKWSRLNAGTLIALAVTVTLAKMVYLPLAALPMISRKPHGDRLRWVLPPVLAVAIALIFLAAWLRLNAGLAVPMHAGMPEPRTQVDFLMHHPTEFAGVLARTYSSWGMYLDQIFVFGWVNVGPVRPALWLTLMALALAILRGDPRAGLLSLVDRAWTLLLLLAIVVLLSLAIYIAGNALGAKTIVGLQGRYFVPLILPFSLILMPTRPERMPLVSFMVAVLMIVADLKALLAIGHAYYL